MKCDPNRIKKNNTKCHLSASTLADQQVVLGWCLQVQSLALDSIGDVTDQRLREFTLEPVSSACRSLQCCQNLEI